MNLYSPYSFAISAVRLAVDEFITQAGGHCFPRPLRASVPEPRRHRKRYRRASVTVTCSPLRVIQFYSVSWVSVVFVVVGKCNFSLIFCLNRNVAFVLEGVAHYN